MRFKYPRRWSKKFLKEINELFYNIVEKIGCRKVVVLDNKHPAIGYVVGNNNPVGRKIPMEAILKIIEVN